MKSYALFLVICGAGLCTISCINNPATADSTAPSTINHEALVKRGEYLVTTMGCGDCHSPKVMTDHGPEAAPGLLLSGHPAADSIIKIDKSLLSGYVLFNQASTMAIGPWGASYAANLTSDETGIGKWTPEQFARALKEGKSKGLAANRTLLPPMPWPNYAHIANQDLEAIFTYLKSTKPVHNVPPIPRAPTQL